ncbi:IclR family transcriptional regulator [Lampropedia aestuarii]|uniref:IclR family transcriptional regulator n=1 Tax=Lampropedia aestuarii TaxID=2562762 RepID=A0A4S5BWT6_9BURK|nr:IclR family transcriptional regulator [Lampropedia aestuarii]MDH5856001.1 IclR family transcriptional regulator [Lampropedia aestuarii]THJ35691.1 IclR family transcriptional regulator [Lampropedia aestuarii]
MKLSPEKMAEVAEVAEDESAGNRYSAPALEKGLDILEALATTTEGVTLNQLAGMLGRNVNQIFRMVATLHQRGYIQTGSDDRYSLTLKIFRLAHRQPPLKLMIELAQPLLRELAERSKQSCHLAVYEQGRMVVVSQADSPERWSLGLKVGAVMGLTDTSSGHVLLAYQDEVGRTRMLNSRVKVDGEQDMDPGHLLELLAEVRRDGGSVMPSIQIHGVTNIAQPVRGSGARVVAAINIPYIARIDKAPGPSIEEVRQMQADICRRLSIKLGFDEEAAEGSAQPDIATWLAP